MLNAPTEKWQRRALVFTVALLTISPSQALRYSFRHFSQEDGLANSVVRCLLQDREGFLAGHRQEAIAADTRALLEQVMQVSRGHPLILDRLAAVAEDRSALTAALQQLERELEDDA